ncbi:type I glyceraldehyde-3-phosphate dehydrogenase [Candidatus Shapirobacteria bacterium]|nr:type I glyceraldehyde-3-phosphate dehydrogenase [Candidatus Shapirobacteria bacterium]
MIKIGLNGFGRIGRITLRVILAKYLSHVKVVIVNTSGSMDISGWAHLFEYDSVYGQFKGKVSFETNTKKSAPEIGTLVVNHQRIPVLAEREPGKIPWKRYGADVVLEATGVFRDRQTIAAHFQGGAKKIIVAAPAKDVQTFVVGVNQEKYQNHLILSNASCTTNCVAPITKVMKENFGVLKAMMTTTHAYTSDQELVDGSHHDLRRARAAAINIVPTSTGATVATTEVLPSLKGLFAGLSLRVPVVCGSLADFCFLTTHPTSVEKVNQAFKKAAAQKYKGIIAVSDQPLVSSDIIGNSASAVVDLSLTQVIDNDLVKVVAWYDNEWAYACRLVEQIIWVSKH